MLEYVREITDHRNIGKIEKTARVALIALPLLTLTACEHSYSINDSFFSSLISNKKICYLYKGLYGVDKFPYQFKRCIGEYTNPKNFSCLPQTSEFIGYGEKGEEIFRSGNLIEGTCEISKIE